MKRLLYVIIKNLGFVLSNNQYTNLLFWFNNYRLNKSYYKLNIDSPITFNEKINYIKYTIRNSLSQIVADKISVRKYVNEKIGEKYLIPLIAIFNSADEISFDILPDQFAMKLNNGSGYNLICTQKSMLNVEQERVKFAKAMKTDIYLLSREWQYKEICPKILVEKLLEHNLKDYKFFCNREGPFMVQVDVDRFTNHTRNIYNLNWELMPFKLRYENSVNAIEKPICLDEMIQVAKVLSADFLFCRIDLYEHDGIVYFGEITLHPGGGVEPFDSYNSDVEMGKFINL